MHAANSAYASLQGNAACGGQNKMPITDIPALAALRTRMQWHQQRQRVLAENIANSDTPNFKPRDLVEPKFNASTPGAPGATAGALTLARTDPAHMTLSAGSDS